MTTSNALLNATKLKYVFVTYDTIQNIRDVTDTRYNYLETRGYYTVNDGGGAKYYADLTDTTSADNGGSIIVGTSGIRWKLMHSAKKIVNVRQFGAKGDGTTDDTPAITNAIKFVSEIGGSLEILPGTYACAVNADWSGALAGSGFPAYTGASFTTKAFTIRGVGGRCVLKANGAYALRIAYPFKSGSSDYHAKNIRLRDFEVDMGSAKKGIEINSAKSLVIENINFYGGVDGTTTWADAFALGLIDTGMFRLKNLNLDGVNTMVLNSGIFVNGVGAADAIIEGCDIDGYGIGIHINNSPGDIMIHDNVVYAQGVDCIRVDCANRDCSQMRIKNNHLAYPAQHMVRLADNTTYYALAPQVIGNFLWFDKDGGDGIYMGRTLRALVNDNNMGYIDAGVGSGHAAVNVSATSSRWVIRGNIIERLATGGTAFKIAGFYGTVQGNLLQDVQTDDATTKFIDIVSATASRVRIQDNVCHPAGSTYYAVQSDGEPAAFKLSTNNFYGGVVYTFTDQYREEFSVSGIYSNSGTLFKEALWNRNPIRIGNIYMWNCVSGANTGKLMAKNGQPGGDNDGSALW